MRIKRRKPQNPKTKKVDTPNGTEKAVSREEIDELVESVDKISEQITVVTNSTREVVDTMADLQKSLKGSEKTPAQRQEITERQLSEAQAINKRNKRIIPIWGGELESVDANYLFKGITEKTPPDEVEEVLTKVLCSPTDSALIKDFQRHCDRVKIARDMLDNSQVSSGDYKKTKWYREYQQFLENSGIDKILTVGNATTDFIPEGWSMEILSRFYQELEVASAFMEFELPHSPFNWPLMGRGKARRRVRPTASARGVAANEYPEDSSDTNKVTFESETLSVRQDLEEEFVEDSPDMLMNLLTDVIIPETMAEGIESALVNGDIRAHSVATGRDQNHEATDVELAWDGLRRIALSQSTTLNVGNNSGTYDFGDFARLLAKGGKYLIKPKNGFWIFENNSYTHALTFDEVETYDKHPIPTNINGVVNMLLGRPVLVSGEWPLTHTDGYVSSTAANNIKGGFLCANKSQFAIGYSRAERTEQMKDILTGFFYVVSTCRKDFQALENLASGYTPVALAINVPLS